VRQIRHGPDETWTRDAQLSLVERAAEGTRGRSCAGRVLPLQHFVYRQIMYIALLEAVITALAGRRLHWQHMHHSGHAATSISP
jgi:hypothetical protein